jgi:hypothetical protein
MTEKNDPAARWHSLEIQLRADLYERARERGIDIGDLCNRALTDALGPDHRDAQSCMLPASVIIARDGGSPGVPAALPVPAAKALHPVINAEDPSASTKVKLAKRQPAAVPQPQDTKPAPPGITPPKELPEKGKDIRRQKKVPVRKTRQDLMKMFFASSVSREDDGGEGTSKEAMYEAFARWCREHRIQPVPDRRALTVALKNQFALQETELHGVPSWVGVRLK